LAEIKEKLTLAKSTKERNAKIKEEESKVQTRLKKESEELSAKIEAAVVASNVREEAIAVVTKHFVNWLVVKTCDNLQQTMNEVIHEIFPNYFVRLEQSTHGVKFLYTKDEGLEKNAHNRWLDGRMSSGFERALLSVAFRVALCMLYEIPLLIIDEIDSVADDESSKQLYEHIFSLGNFEQTILISHKPEIRFLLTDTIEEAMVYHVEGGNFVLEE
jgi:chromosome segregation ATPase